MSEDDVLAYASGATSERWREWLHQHLDACESCRLLLQSTIADDAQEPGAVPASVSEALGENVFTTFSPGKCIAERYLIESFIGKGGMGEVYCAFDQLLGKRVALKTVLCTSGDDPRAIRKLIDEVRHAETITHPNVCRIQTLLEHREPSGTRPPVPFFTMEFIEGETLAVRCKRGLLELPLVRTIARQLLEGLKAAHGKGVRHLDFKSDNVMLRKGSQVDAVVMDFGLSRDRETRSRTSEHGGWMGTLPYMALEQLEGRPNLGPSVDIYAFGVVLYEMLTGQLPFQGSLPSALIVKQMRERPPAASHIRSQLSPDVDAFVQKCLRRSPDERFGDAASALEAFDSIERWERRASVVSLRARQGIAVLGLVVVFGGLALLVGTGRPTSTRPGTEIGRLQSGSSPERAKPITPLPAESPTALPASPSTPSASASSAESPEKTPRGAERPSPPASLEPAPEQTRPTPRVESKPTTPPLSEAAPSASSAELSATQRALKHVPRRPLTLKAPASVAASDDVGSKPRTVGEPRQAATPE